MKTVVVARDGSRSVADHLADMKTWLAENNIVPRELTIRHVLRLRVIFSASFDNDADADRFVGRFGSS